MKPLRWLLGSIAAVLIGTLCANYLSGEIAFKRLGAELTRRGEPTTWKALFPPALPPNREHFSEHPLLLAQLRFRETDAGEIVYDSPELQERLGAVRADWNARGFANLSTRLPTDFCRMAESLGLRIESDDSLVAVANRLSKFDSPLAELQAIAKLPAGHFGTWYDVENPGELAMPHMTQWIHIARVSGLRASVRLARREGVEAIEELGPPFRLAEAISVEPMLLSTMVEITILVVILPKIWEGLSSSAWTESDLAALAEQLNRLHPKQDFLNAMRGEALTSGFWMSELTDAPAAGPLRWLGRFPGAVSHNKSNYARFVYEHIIIPLEQNDWRAYQENQNPPEIEGEAVWRQLNPNWIFVRAVAPQHHAVMRKLMFLEFQIAAGRVALALEGHKLRHGFYPDSLDRLVPELIADVPRDPMSGTRKLSYERTDNRYRIWSIGRNSVDDGGVVAWRISSDGTKSMSDVDGDWVWDYDPPPSG